MIQEAFLPLYTFEFYDNSLTFLIDYERFFLKKFRNEIFSLEEINKGMYIN